MGRMLLPQPSDECLAAVDHLPGGFGSISGLLGLAFYGILQECLAFLAALELPLLWRRLHQPTCHVVKRRKAHKMGMGREVKTATAGAATTTRGKLLLHSYIESSTYFVLLS